MWITQVDPIWVLKSRESFSAVMREQEWEKSQNERGERECADKMKGQRDEVEYREIWSLRDSSVLPNPPCYPHRTFSHTVALLLTSESSPSIACMPLWTKPVLTHNVFSAFTFLHSLLLVLHCTEVHPKSCCTPNTDNTQTCWSKAVSMFLRIIIDSKTFAYVNYILYLLH